MFRVSGLWRFMEVSLYLIQAIPKDWKPVFADLPKELQVTTVANIELMKRSDEVTKLSIKGLKQ